MTSLGIMIQKIAGLAGTKDVSAWESDFIRSIVDQSSNGESTFKLSSKQVEIVERIHNKHFASNAAG